MFNKRRHVEMREDIEIELDEIMMKGDYHQEFRITPFKLWELLSKKGYMLEHYQHSSGVMNFYKKTAPRVTYNVRLNQIYSSTYCMPHVLALVYDFLKRARAVGAVYSKESLSYIPFLIQKEFALAHLRPAFEQDLDTNIIEDEVTGRPKATVQYKDLLHYLHEVESVVTFDDFRNAYKYVLHPVTLEEIENTYISIEFVKVLNSVLGKTMDSTPEEIKDMATLEADSSLGINSELNYATNSKGHYFDVEKFIQFEGKIDLRR